MPSWAERVAAQIKSVPRRINRALQPETPAETAALVGASFAPGLSEAIDGADFIAGMHDRDLARMGFASAGFLLPFVAGSTLRRVAGKARATVGNPRLPMDDASVKERLRKQGYTEYMHGNMNALKEDQGRASSFILDPNKPLMQSDNPALARSYGEEMPIYSRGPNQLEFDARGAAWSDISLDDVREGIDPNLLKEFEQLRPPTNLRSQYENTISTDQLNATLRDMGYSGFDAHDLRDSRFSGIRQSDNRESVRYLQEGEIIQDPNDINLPFAELDQFEIDQMRKNYPGYVDDEYMAAPQEWRRADEPSFVRSTLDPGLIRYRGAKFDPMRLGENNPLAGIAGLLGAGAIRRNYIEREGRDE